MPPEGALLWELLRRFGWVQGLIPALRGIVDCLEVLPALLHIGTGAGEALGLSAGYHLPYIEDGLIIAALRRLSIRTQELFQLRRAQLVQIGVFLSSVMLDHCLNPLILYNPAGIGS